MVYSKGMPKYLIFPNPKVMADELGITIEELEATARKIIKSSSMRLEAGIKRSLC